jgi:hypothetical protein
MPLGCTGGLMLHLRGKPYLVRLRNMYKSEISSGADKIYVNHLTSSNQAIQATKQVEPTFVGLKYPFSDRIFHPTFIRYSLLESQLMATTIIHSKPIDLFDVHIKILIPNPYYLHCFLIRVCSLLVFPTFPLRYISQSSKSRCMGTIR